MKNRARLLGLGLILGALTAGLSACNNATQEDVMPEKLIIGMECDYQPFNWSTDVSSEYTLPIGNHSGTYADGYDVQIAKRLGQEIGLEVEIVQTVWDSLVPDLQQGSINMIIAGMTDTEERRESISFTNEYYRSELVLVTLAEVADQYSAALDETTFASLINGKVLVSQTSTVTNDVLDTFASEYGAIHASPLDTFGLCATDVENGSAFAMTAELPVAQSLCNSSDKLGIIHIDQEILGETQAELGVSIGINKWMTTLQGRLNEALATISTTERVSIMSDCIARRG